MTSGGATYAWCWDHGRLHRFTEQEGAWCSALWVPLAGSSEELALADKRLRFGGARFFGELAPTVQASLVTDRE